MAFETAIRNPERYLSLLSELKEFDNVILNDENLLKIVVHLYLTGEATSKRIEVNEETTFNDIVDKVKDVNSTRKADGGFPEGYQSRFWTYMRTLSELGFVYARYNEKLLISDIGLKLISHDIDEQEAFSIQAMSYNRKSPYRNVSNDFNFFRFLLSVLFKLRDERKALTYEQFIIATFSENGNVDDFLNLISKNKFPDYNTVFNFVNQKYGNNNKFSTVIKDYPDVIRRILFLCGFISIKYSGKKLIYLNENKIGYIRELLKVDSELSEYEKVSAKHYYEALNKNSDIYLGIAFRFRESETAQHLDYHDKIKQIVKDYNLTTELVAKSISVVGTRKNYIEEFSEIPEPLKLEFFISILLFLIYGEKFKIKPNYKTDHFGKPYSHAPGNIGDIEVFSDDIYWLIEVTLIRNRIQQLNHETTTVIRHLTSNTQFVDHKEKYLSFVAPYIHTDTENFFQIATIHQQMNLDQKIFMKPYPSSEFIQTTLSMNNFADMRAYANGIMKDFADKLNFSQ